METCFLFLHVCMWMLTMQFCMHYLFCRIACLCEQAYKCKSLFLYNWPLRTNSIITLCSTNGKNKRGILFEWWRRKSRRYVKEWFTVCIMISADSALLWVLLIECCYCHNHSHYWTCYFYILITGILVSPPKWSILTHLHYTNVHSFVLSVELWWTVRKVWCWLVCLLELVTVYTRQVWRTCCCWSQTDRRAVLCVLTYRG